MAAEDTASSGGNLLTRKAGPLPTWGWLAIITVAGLGYYLWHKSHTTTAATAASTAPGQTSASNVPDYVFQNYNQIPPTTPAPAPPPAGTPAPAPTTPPPSTTPATVTPGAVPNLRGMTLAAATAALQGTGYSISNVSSGYKDLSSSQVQAAQSRTIYSYTPYSNHTVRIGLN